MRGMSRMPGVGVDLSNRMGNDSMFLFNTPKDWDKESVAAWLWDMAAGPAGEMPLDMLSFIQDGDIGKLPLPKIARDGIKAWNKMEHGVVNRAGRKVEKEWSGLDAFRQLMGFTPATAARSWEGGSGTQSKQKRKTSRSRQELLDEWNNAKTAGGKVRAENAIRRWNRDHPEKGERIDRMNLKRSAQRRKQLDKEVENQ